MGVAENCIISNCAVTGAPESDPEPEHAYGVRGSESVGGIVGRSIDSQIIACTNYANVYLLITGEGAARHKLGGIVGVATLTQKGTNNIMIDKCQNLGKVECTTENRYECTGGIVGRLVSDNENYRAVVQNCTNDAVVMSIEAGTGGIVGFAQNSSIENCNNQKPVTGTTGVGGIAGYAYYGTQILNCDNTGKITGKPYNNEDPLYPETISAFNVGGIVGSVYNPRDTSHLTEGCDILPVYSYNRDSIIKGCTNTGDVECLDTYDEFEGVIIYETEHPDIPDYIILYGSTTGGIVGFAADSAYFSEEGNVLRIKNCTNSGNVKGAKDDGNATYTGGVLGCGKNVAVINSSSSNTVAGADTDDNDSVSNYIGGYAYTVRFDANGGSVYPGQILLLTKYDKMTKPNDPTLAHHTFDAWYKDIELNDEFDFTNDVITQKTTLYAGWNPKSYNVSFDANGGTPVSGKAVTWTDELLDDETSTRYGYRFDGWMFGDKTVGAGDEYGTVVGDDTLDGITLKAKWVDVEAPVISGVTGGAIYCSSQTVTVSDNDGIANVTVNGSPVVLDEHNKFTLLPAEGTQTIVATDKTGNTSTQAAVTVKDGHTYELKSESGYYWQKCKICGYETIKTTIPTVIVAGKDEVCKTQDYEFNVNVPMGITITGVTAETGTTSALTLTPVSEGKYKIASADYGGGTLKITANLKTTEGFTFSSKEKTVTVLAEHKYENGKCTVCGTERLYTVTFNSNGGNSINAKNDVKWNGRVLDNISAPTYVAKDGYEFVCWKYGNTEVTTQTEYKALVSSDSITNIELTAQWKDVVAATGEIKLSTNTWKKSLNNITFGLFFKDTQDVIITATDNSNKAVTIEYLLSDRELTKAQLDEKTFTAYSDKFSIEPNNEYVIYAKLTDSSNNYCYINSDGIVLDNTAPVISGIVNGKTYCEAQTVSVSDKYGVTVTVNDSPVTVTNGKFTLFPAIGSQNILAKDQAGNISSEMIVTINEGHDYEWQSENGQYWQECKCCGDETEKKDIPVIALIGKDKVCKTQDYAFSFTLPQDVTNSSVQLYCDEQTTDVALTDNDGVYSSTIIASDYPNKAAFFEVRISAETADGFKFMQVNKVTIQYEHSGGTSTCTEKAKCEICGVEYGELNNSNHDLEYIEENAPSVIATGNKEYWHCRNCNKNFSDKDGKNIIEEKDIVIGKLLPEIIEGNGQSLNEGEKKEPAIPSDAPDEAYDDSVNADLDGDTVEENTSTSPETGDYSRVVVCFVLLIASGGLIIVTVICRKKICNVR